MDESKVNLEELRDQLTSRVALLLIAAGAVLIWIWLLTWVSTSPRQPFPFTALGLLAGMAGLSWGAHSLLRVRRELARHLLVWGLTLELLVAISLFPDPWLPFLGLLLMFVSAMLVSSAAFATSGAIAAAAIGWEYAGARTYPLLPLLTMLGLGTILAWLSVRTFYTALEWALTMQQRGDHLLGVARDRQAELGRALKSLDQSNTLLRRTQRELIAARQQADEARLMKEQFAANVSHELRTPLSLILGFSEVMCLSSEVYGPMEWPPALRQDVYQIYHNSRHLLEMIDDVLNLSRLEMAGFTLTREPTALEPLLRDTVALAQDLFRSRPVQLETQIAPNLPTLEIDPTRIRQVLLNLLNNAARFTEEGTVQVEAKLADREVIVSVHDTGPGIPPDELPHLFEEFYQADRSLHRQHSGTGLGLAISKHFVEAHDGHIRAESKEGTGSTFTFTLPIPGEHVPFSRLSTEPPLQPLEEEPRSPVLVVDPDPEVCEAVRNHLDRYDVIQVESSRRLAEAVVTHHPRAVVHNVPPGEQAEVVDFPQASVPVIECSLPSHSWVTKDLAVTAHLTKPITAGQLVEAIDRVSGARDVLVVDDERGFCQMIERMLKASGDEFTVRQAYNGEKALQAMEEQIPDLLLLDLVMPGMNGFQVLEQMRRSSELIDVPVVLVTATSYAEDVLAQHGGRMTVRRSAGLRPFEVLGCLQALVEGLEARYDEPLA